MDTTDNDTLEFFSKQLEQLKQLDERFIEQYKEVERCLLENKELLYDIVEAAPIAIWVLDDDGAIFVRNEAARRSQIDLQSITIDDNGKEIEIGKKFFVLQVTRQKNRLIITATDNTAFRRNERLISMGQMAAHLAHEIRNPIGAVSIIAGTLYSRVSLRDKPLVLEIKRSIWRVERIVKATLLFSKGFTLNPRRFILSDLIEDLKNGIENYSYSKVIDFDFNLSQVYIEADFDLLLLVLQNMVFNAIDAIEECEDETGKIVIKSISDREIEIYDSGKPFETPDRLFEAFHTTKTKGHGLGLILSRQIIEAHKGTIELLHAKKGFLIRL
ncbi:two-component sensor histidine kinase [Campylobacterota bacterium]|nr:two-component sensor histidine kinase [Campylobacterota bacterium]